MSVRRLDPKALFKVISASDDAIVVDTADDLVSGEKDKNGEFVVAPTSYEQYVEEASFDESKLKFHDGKQPDRFLLRSLTADELADLNQKYIVTDTVAKKVYITNRNKMFLDMFRAAYQGIEANGVVEKVPADEIPFGVQIEMGAIVSLIGNLGKNLKK